MKGSRAIPAALALYPPWWRDRYGDEVLAVSSRAVSGGQSAVHVALGLMAGALRTRVTGRGTPRRLEFWAGRTRACTIVATIPALAVLPLVFLTFKEGQADHLPLATVPSTMLSHAGRTAIGALAVMALAGMAGIAVIIRGYAALLPTSPQRLGRAARWALGLVSATVLVVVVATANTLIFFAMVALGTVVWGSVLLARTRRDRLIALPGVLAVLAVLAWIASLLAGPHRYLLRQGVDVPLNGNPALAHALLLVAAALLGTGWMATFMLLARVSRSAPTDTGNLLTVRGAGVAVSALLWVMAGAALVSALALRTQGLPAHPPVGVLTTSWGQWWTAGAIGLMAAALVSTAGSVAAWRSWRVASTLI